MPGAISFRFIPRTTLLLIFADTRGGPVDFPLPPGLRAPNIRMAIKDEYGNASTNNITLTPFGNDLIDTQPLLVMDQDFSSVELIQGNAGWIVLSSTLAVDLPTVDFVIQYLGPPLVGFPIQRILFREGVTFPEDFVGSSLTSDAPAQSVTLFDIKRNGIDIATVTFQAGSSEAVFAGSTVTFSPGDVMTIVTEVADPTLSFISGNLVGTRA